MSYLTIHEVRDRLRIDEDFAESDLHRMMIEAEDIVAAFLKLETSYSPSTVPPRVKTATLLVVRSIYDTVDDPLTDAVRSILSMSRAPTLA